jgi:predicted nucleic acid-binding protein
MNGTKNLLDTNVILYILSGDETLANHLYRKILYASFISEIVLFGFKGLTAKEEKSKSSFLAPFRIINGDEAIKREAIALRKEYGLKSPDCILAATAISLQLTLITADKQFRQVERLN